MSHEPALRHLVSDHRLQRLCREWEARLPGAGVLFHAENINNIPNPDTNSYAYPLPFEPYPEPPEPDS